MAVTQQQLVGRWKSDLTDQATRSSVGAAIQEFFPEGLLLYAARRDGDTAVMELHYRVEDGWLVTNQPSAPREERSPIAVDEAGRLLIGTGAERSVFIRAPGATLADVEK